MTKTIKGAGIALLLCGTSVFLNAQDAIPFPGVDNKMLPSVSGSSSIGNIHSPNLFDGSTNIQIPFYSFENEYGNYGVSFTYNTKGVKVEEYSGTIGLHWNLAAGGSIQRVVKDIPDEIYFDNTSTLPPLGETQPIFLLGKMAHALSSIDNPYTYIGTNLKSHFDEAFDDFIVSVPGLSFTFNIGKGGYIFTHPKQYVKIEILVGGVLTDTIPLNSGNVGLSFRVTDSRGVRYLFEPDVKRAVSYSAYKNNSVEQQVYFNLEFISNWRLTKIIFPNKTEIAYTYTSFKEKMGGKTLNTTQFVTNNNTAPSFSAIEGQNFTIAVGDVSGEAAPALLETILYPNNVTVQLHYKDMFGPAADKFRCDFKGAKLLDMITIESRNRSLHYSLEQYYLPSTGPKISKNTGCTGYEGNSMRLFLDKIYILNRAKTDSLLYYAFDYESERLPETNSGAKDFFGYYNGYTAAGTTSIPRHRNVLGRTDSSGVHRPHNASFAKAGLLNKITNGYGGIVEFMYEGHVLTNSTIPVPASLQDFLGMNANDGVRLQRTIYYDIFFPAKKASTYYNYFGGIRFINGGYFHAPKVYNAAGVPTSAYVSSDFLSAHQLINGSNHGYSYVTTDVYNNESELLSVKSVKYTNIVDSANANKARYTLVGGGKHYYGYPYADKQYLREWEIGLPVEIREFDQGGRLLSRSVNTYQFAMDTTSTLGKIRNALYFKKLGGTSTVKIDSNTYRPYTGHALLSRSINYQYVTNSSMVTDTVDYTYNDRQEPLMITTRNSKKERIALKNLYHHQVASPPASLSSIPGHMSLLLGYEKWKLHASLWKQDLLLDASYTQYAYDAVNMSFQNNKVWKMEPGLGITRELYEGPGTFPDVSFQLRKIYSGTAPDTYIRPVTEVLNRDTRGNAEGVQVAGMDIYAVSLWDKELGNKLAEASGCLSSDMGFAGFDEAYPSPVAITGHQQKSGNFTADLDGYTTNPATAICGRYLNLSTYFGYKVRFDFPLVVGKEYTLAFWSRDGFPTVSGGGISSFSFEEIYTKGAWKYYVARFVPVSTTTVQINGKPGLDIKIDEVRLYPSEVEMQSYTYVPLFGLTASSDARGRITYYEYDDFGRMITIRDQEGRILKHTDLNKRIPE